MGTLPPLREMERAYLERDAAYDGLFFLGVRTTAVFCRPTCAARKPLPKNVEYFPTAGAALFAGYRPCKRCRPLEPDARPAWVSRLLAEVDRDPMARIRERDLRARGVDPATVRRFFLKEFGMTFQAYTRSRRLAGALQRIREGGELDSAVFDSGYESHSGFREAFARLFGAPPGKGAPGDCVLLSWLRSPLGPLVAGATAAGVCLLEFTDRRMLETQLAAVRRRFGGAVAPGTNPHLELLQDELAGYFAGRVRRFTVPLLYPGTAFQRQVWERLLAIPYGETLSYEGLAVAIGKPQAVRAVGHANGHNRIAIVIPCHRVINKDGKLGGYGGGLRRKQFLLELERSGGRAPSLFADGAGETEAAPPAGARPGKAGGP
jgi:AraC family transcriptional regulator, regulatory protein of adaptative response / methylated-DNA-[protein]-cysteine methyltransferase